jgi:hypothetical protein
LRLGDHKLGELIKDLIELDVVLALGEIFVVAEGVTELALAVQKLVEVPHEKLEFADIATLLVTSDALDEDLIDAFEAGNEVAVHVFDFGVVGEQFGEMGFWVEVVVVAHEVLSQEDAGVEPAAHFRVDLLCVVHQFLKFLGESDHALGEGRQQSLDQVEIFVKFAAIDHHCFSLEVIEGHLEVDLLKLFHKSLGLLLFVQFHLRNCLLNIEL